MNDYGFELSSDQPIPLEEKHLQQILSKENLIQDVMASINAAEMAKLFLMNPIRSENFQPAVR